MKGITETPIPFTELQLSRNFEILFLPLCFGLNFPLVS